MKNILSLSRLFIFASVLSAATSYADTFDYSFTFGDGSKVSGSFDGTQNGNLINGISSVSLFVNGNSVDTGAGIFAEGYDAGHKFQNGLAQVSIDGTQNSFLFVNGDLGGGQAYSGYFLSIGNGAGNPDLMEAFDSVHGFYNYNLVVPTSSNWQVTERTSQAVPEIDSTIGLFASAVVGLAALRRRFFV